MTELLDFILHHEDQFKSKARLASLYSDFRVQRTTNPDGYAANITAWQKALTDAVDAGKIPTADKVSSAFCLKTGEELVEALEITGYGRPLALGAVMDEAISEGIMIPLQTFLTESKSIYDKSWSAQSRWLISWGLKRLGLAVSPSSKDRLVRGQFVVASSLEKAASKILASKSGRSNRVDRVSSRKMFKQEIEELLELPHRLSDSDLNALLTLLDRDKKEITYSNNVIKFNAVKEPAAITSYDETIASLKTLIADLNLQIDSLASHVNELAEKARMAVKQNNRVSALATLRAKRVSESLISRRSETLAQLEEVFNKIAQAEDQVAFITVMEATAAHAAPSKSFFMTELPPFNIPDVFEAQPP
ncbi:hypothetical protein MMC06_001853 [Schaereria dolodes]|nr:hypothetical protein [Schaereria dolodes]